MTIATYFTKETDVKSIILELLDKAQSNVVVAVAWFTETSLFNKLLELQKRGVTVDLIITNHEFNQQSRNDYSSIERNGGFFAEIGTDDQLMHMKFCVIDFATVISGSANWSNRAFTVNNEEVTIVEGHNQRASDFITEFERLKLISGKINDLKKELDLSKALKTFDLIKAFINIGETQNIHPYAHQLKHIVELNHISALLYENKFDEAIRSMDEFRKSHSQLVDVASIEKEQIKGQIKLITFHIESLEFEKTEIETLLEQFNHRHIIELNPLISKVLALKKKIYEKLIKLGYTDDTYKEIEDEFNRSNEEYEKEIKIDIPDLNEEDNKSIKEMYREASWLCSPNSHRRVIEDEVEAAKVFDELTKAYKRNDIDKVRYIYSELKLGNQINDLDQYDELTALRAKLESLKIKLNYLLNEVSTLKSSDSYRLISDIQDWNEYFENQKQLLEQEFNELNEKFVKDE